MNKQNSHLFTYLLVNGAMWLALWFGLAQSSQIAMIFVLAVVYYIIVLSFLTLLSWNLVVERCRQIIPTVYPWHYAMDLMLDLSFALILFINGYVWTAFLFGFSTAVFVMARAEAVASIMDEE